MFKTKKFTEIVQDQYNNLQLNCICTMFDFQQFVIQKLTLFVLHEFYKVLCMLQIIQNLFGLKWYTLTGNY